MRVKMRDQHNIHGDLCTDACTSIWCPWCALAQMSREMDYVSEQPAMVITQQPGITTVGPQRRDWSSDMCACCMDPCSCLGAFCCMPFYTCHTLTRMHENCCVGWLSCFALSAMRASFRSEHGINGDLCNDVCSSWWCSCCVLAQLSREIDYVNKQPTIIIRH
uniref:Uncharacterized protein n=1 Tax=Branchiostoma floridae TaxID=7739 RepID=C3Y4W0_BRAFL|eukprot:XP_002608757.1 hypothetical protein BRAFLDRAFT_73978 [Branchiostoma floridae]